MDNHIIKDILHGVQLKGDIVSILGEEMYYRLYMIRRSGVRLYVINITNGKESSTCCFGKDRKSAVEVYGKIVDNTVTPCTLCDIAEDFSKRSKKN